MKLGILGAGTIAHTMADTVRRMQASGRKEVELYAVAARDAARAQAFAEQFGMPRAYGSYEAMLQDVRQNCRFMHFLPAHFSRSMEHS